MTLVAERGLMGVLLSQRLDGRAQRIAVKHYLDRDTRIGEMPCLLSQFVHRQRGRGRFLRGEDSLGYADFPGRRFHPGIGAQCCVEGG